MKHAMPVLASNEAIVYENGSEALTTSIGNTQGKSVRLRNDYADHKGSKDTVREKVFGIKCMNFIPINIDVAISCVFALSHSKQREISYSRVKTL